MPSILEARAGVNIENLDLDVEIGDIEWGHPFKGE